VLPVLPVLPLSEGVPPIGYLTSAASRERITLYHCSLLFQRPHSGQSRPGWSSNILSCQERPMADRISATCAGCKVTGTVPAAWAGKQVRCKHCGSLFTVCDSTQVVVQPAAIDAPACGKKEGDRPSPSGPRNTNPSSAPVSWTQPICSHCKEPVLFWECKDCNRDVSEECKDCHREVHHRRIKIQNIHLVGNKTPCPRDDMSPAQEKAWREYEGG
jgi:hypothetical protein